MPSDTLDALREALARPNPLAELGRRVKRLELERSRQKTKQARRKKRWSTLTPTQMDVFLARFREKSPVNWGDLTDKQEFCARLRWQTHMKVSEIAQVLGRHRSTVDEHLARAKARTDRQGNFDRRKKQQAKTKRDIA